MKISDEAINTIYVFFLILFIANICITRAEHVERTKDTKELIRVVDKSAKAKEANTLMLEKVELEQKHMNQILEHYKIFHKGEE